MGRVDHRSGWTQLAARDEPGRGSAGRQLVAERRLGGVPRRRQRPHGRDRTGGRGGRRKQPATADDTAGPPRRGLGTRAMSLVAMWLDERGPCMRPLSEFDSNAYEAKGEPLCSGVKGTSRSGGGPRKGCDLAPY